MAQDPRKDRHSRVLPGSTATLKQRAPLINTDSLWFKGALLLTFLALLVAVLVLRFQPPSSVLTPSQIGSIAPDYIPVTRDFSYSRVDTEATAQQREQRAQAVPRIYRWDTAWADDSAANLQRTFSIMRAELSDLRRALSTPASITPPPRTPSPPPIPPPARDILYRAAISAALALFPWSSPGVFAPPLPVLSALIDRHRTRHLLALRQHRAFVFGIIQGFSVNAAHHLSMTQQATTLRMRDARAHDAEVERSLIAYALERRPFVSSEIKCFFDPITYDALAAHLFDESLEADLLTLLSATLRRPIVPSRLTDHDAITIQQRYKDQPPSQSWVNRDPSGLPDLSRAFYDLNEQAHILLASRPPNERQALQDGLRHLIRSNTSPDDAATLLARDAARAEVKDLYVQEHRRRGDVLVRAGDRITAEHITAYHAMTGDAERGQLTALTEIFGLLTFLIISIGGLVLLLRRDLVQRFPRQRDLVFLGATLLGMVLVVRLSPTILKAVGQAWAFYAPELTILMIPFAAGAMMTRLVLNGAVALTFSLTFALLIGLVLDQTRLIIPYVLTSGIVGSIVLRAAKTRMSVLQAGLNLGLLNAAAATGLILLLEPQAFGPSLWSAAQIPLFAFVGGVMSGILVTVLLPVVEHTFDYTTAIKLLELANLEHPLLKDLLMKAPGSYHHSMMVGSLNEAAAEAIQADALLVRVGAYYHDIGKMKNPQYFAENQHGDNPHDRLKPQMSALILKSHVKDGIEMARHHKLPAAIIDFIATHHGTSRIEYFYHRAREQEQPGMPETNEIDYRYPGPRPQSRETGICMICDSVEAAVRSLPEKSPDRIKALVQKLIHSKFIDGQFSECNLTLADLNAIASALFRVLTSIYHHRPEYPGSAKSDRSRPATKAALPPVASSSSKLTSSPSLPAGVLSAAEDSSAPLLCDPSASSPPTDHHQPPTSPTSPSSKSPSLYAADLTPAPTPAALFRSDRH